MRVRSPGECRNSDGTNTLTARISTFCVLSSTLAALALSANGASAGSLVPAAPKPVVPKFNVQPNPHKNSIPLYRQGGAYLHVEKVPGREKSGTITLNRGVVGNKTLQQWGQGVTGGGGVVYKGAAVTRCPGC
jgi:hypothetical protein